jgi:hypothetical protein
VVGVVIHAVATVYNEEHIIGRVLKHLYAEGVDHVWIADASTDQTREVYREYRDRLTVLDDMDDFHYQPRWTNRLVQFARAEGASWILPFDADEFWYSLDGQTVADRLNGLPDSVVAIRADVWQHFDEHYRNPAPQALGKVAFRPTELTVVANGNHSVAGVVGDGVNDVLAIREIQFSSLDHLHRKSRERADRLDPSLGQGEGQHQRDLAAGTEAHRAADWDARKARASVFDPIPFR